MKHSFWLVLVWSTLAFSKVYGQVYDAADLGAFVPNDVNDQVQMLGRIGTVPHIFKDGAVIPMQHLGAGGKANRWSGVNGLSVGSVTIPNSSIQAAAQWDLSGALVLLYTRDQSHGSVANAQNKKGFTSGFGGRPDPTQGVVSSAMRWTNAQTLTVLDTANGDWSESIGIDDAGNEWGIDENGQSVVWDINGAQKLVPNNPGRFPNLFAVNKKGIAVGNITRLDSFDILPVEVTLKKGFVVLPILETGAQCQAMDRSDLDVTIGQCIRTSGEMVPVKWQRGKIYPLQVNLPAGFSNLQLTGMNNVGHLTARAGTRLPSGAVETHGFLLVPQQVAKR